MWVGRGTCDTKGSVSAFFSAFLDLAIFVLEGVLLNGVIYGAVFSPQSPLSKNLSRMGSDKDKIKVLFLSLLNREPTAQETADCLELVRRKSSLPSPSLRIPDHWSKEKKDKYRKSMAKRVEELSKSDNKRFLGVAWALMNTRQFTFIQ